MSDDAIRSLEELTIEKAVDRHALGMILADGTRDAKLKEVLECGAKKMSNSLLECARGSLPGELELNFLAECLKDETFRCQVTEDDEIGKRLLRTLTKEIADNDEEARCANVTLLDSSPTVLKHVFRALGNMCYENEKAQKFICDSGGLDVISSFLRAVVAKLEVPPESGEVVEEQTAACLMGCLFNMMDSKPSREALQRTRLLPLVVQSLTVLPEQAVFHAANLLCNACDNEELSQDFVALVPALLDVIDNSSRICSENLELEVTVVQSVFSAATDQEKLHMYDLGIWERTRKLAENCESAINFMFLMLTEDECIERIFDDGKGTEYQLMKSWLTHEKESLRICAALSMGNIARGDAQCHLLVNSSVGDRLVSMISPLASTTQNYSVLSALRNMLIPIECKSRLIEAGLLKKLLALRPIEDLSLAFKFLGCLRMSVDRQPEIAELLGSNRELIECVVGFARVELHEGVRSEAMRVLCWILKNSHSERVCETIASEGGIESLVEMLTSEYSVMKNEAIISLALVNDHCQNEYITGAISNNLSKLSKNIAEVLGNQSLPNEFLENVVTVIMRFSTLSEECFSEFRKTILEPLEQLNQATNSVGLKDKSWKALHILNE